MDFDERNPEMTAETTEQFVASMASTTAVFAHHMARMWPARHDSAEARSSVRDNLRGQRHQRDRADAARSAS